MLAKNKLRLDFRPGHHHIYLIIFTLLLTGLVFAHGTRIVHSSLDSADSGSYTGSIGGNNGGIFIPLQNNYDHTRKFTVSLNYSGVPQGTVALDISYTLQSATTQITNSSYGNPITLTVNVPSYAMYEAGVTDDYAQNKDLQGSFTVTYSSTDTSQPPSTSAFVSMPCSYTPSASAFYPYSHPITCANTLTPSPTQTPAPTPTPTPTLSKDTTAPTVPTGVKAYSSNPTSIGLVWNASTDYGSGVAGYKIYKSTDGKNFSLLTTVSSSEGSDTGLNPSTEYYYYVKAFDRFGNISGSSVVVNATTQTPLTASPVSIAAPKDGDTLSGMVDVWGTTTDKSLVSVEIEVDNNGFVSTTGSTSAWDYKLNTRLYSDTKHSITVKATDSSGKSYERTITVTFNNGTYPTDPPLAQGKWVSPEGMTVSVNSKGKNPHTGQPWTIADVYYMVKACAVGTGDFGLLAPYYSVDLTDQAGWVGPDYTSVGIGTGANGAWSNFTSSTYLDGATGPMLTQPYDVACYEYGHIWTEYYDHLIDYPTSAENLNGSGQIAPPNYLKERWVNKSGTITLAQNDYCSNSTDVWDGCMTDDRRILFGGAGTNGGDDSSDMVPGEPNTRYQEPDIGYINSYIIPPQDQPGLASWYIEHWMTGR